jgi:hypothetical protein
MDGHSMGTATDVNFYTSFTFTRRLHRKKAHSSTGIVGQVSTRREEHGASYEPASADTEESG